MSLLTTAYAPPSGSTRGATSSSVTPSAPRPSDLMPNMIKDYDFLPGVKRWNGIPFHDFTRVWWLALCVALGSLCQNNITLLETANGNDADPGSGDPEGQRNWKARNSRVYACIMNYIVPNCTVSRIAKKEMANDGNGLFMFLEVYGQLAYDDETKQEMLNEWDVATMAKVGIKFTPNGIWEWLEWVLDMADKIPTGKGPAQVRKKFLDGFPESFDNVIASERLRPSPGSYVIANNYPSYHPKAGQLHPDRGKPDMHALLLALEPEWTRRCKRGLIKLVPRGSVYAANDSRSDENNQTNSSDEDEHANYSSRNTSRHPKHSSHSRRHTKPSKSSRTHVPRAHKHRVQQTEHSSSDESDAQAHLVKRSSVNARYICVVCGGRGHASNVDGMECLTKQLGITIPRSELAATKYPNGLKFPEFNSRKPNKPGPNKSSKHHHNKSRHANISEPDPETAVSCPSDSDGSVAAKFAVVYNTINTSSAQYQSMSDSSESQSEEPPKPRTPNKKSATTKATKI